MSRPDGELGACILGCAGESLTDDERRLFASVQPVGFILFARNCLTPDQVRTLVGDLRDSVERPDAPVLIDQEGGRVARLQPPHWPAFPATAMFGSAYRRDPDTAVEAANLNGRLLAGELTNLGVDVDCVPMLDVRADNADPIVIGDRAFSDRAEEVAALGRALADGLLAGGVLPVVKHLPGHGRAVVDSHYELPVVTANRETLRRTDFLPFRALSHLPMAMTGHIVLADYDPDQPATTSPAVIRDVIRGEFGFDGLLITDDVSMGALSGSVAERTAAALAAGCDVALHCNGNLEEMHQVAEAAGRLTPKGWDRFAAIEEFRQVPPAFDKDAARAKRDAILAGGSAG